MAEDRTAGYKLYMLVSNDMINLYENIDGKGTLVESFSFSTFDLLVER